MEIYEFHLSKIIKKKRKKSVPTNHPVTTSKLGCRLMNKSKAHAHSDKRMSFSIDFVEIALVTHTSMKLVNLYVFLITYFYLNL